MQLEQKIITVPNGRAIVSIGFDFLACDLNSLLAERLINLKDTPRIVGVREKKRRDNKRKVYRRRLQNCLPCLTGYVPIAMTAKCPRETSYIFFYLFIVLVVIALQPFVR